MTIFLSTTTDPTPGGYWWVMPAIAFLTLLLGSGGVVAYRRLKLDRQMGVAAQEISEDDAQSARWQKIIEAQTESLVMPLRDRLREVSGELSELEKGQKTLHAEVAMTRTKYWRAIQYVRTLHTWIRARHGHDVEPPPPPAEIAGDI